MQMVDLVNSYICKHKKTDQNSNYKTDINLYTENYILS